MKFFRMIVLFVVLLSLPCLQGTLIAQNSGQDQNGTETSSFDFDFGGGMKVFYYQDALSSILGNQIFTSGGEVDVTKYVLGPNDLITVGIEGSQNIVLRALLVNHQGDIVLPMIGTVNVANQTIAKARETINEAVKSVFKEPRVSISLERPKPLVIQVSGNIEYPGQHIIPAFSRVDAAIYGAIFEVNKSNSVSSLSTETNTVKLLNAGAISLRNIKINHIDGSTDTADLVAYFRAGDQDKNPIVQNGDRISIKQLTKESPRVSISGAVNDGQELEYSPNDSPSLLIEIAGGIKPEADTTKVFVFRNESGSINKIEVLKPEWETFEILPNDRIIVPSNPKLSGSGSAWVHGEVAIPGNFPIKDGQTTALELLTLSGDLTNQALPSAAYLVRAGSLENEIPNKFNTDLMKRTSDQVAQGLEYLDLETKISQNKVFVDLTDEGQLSKVKIYDGDRLYVPRDEETVFVFGQVNNPGYYPYSEGNQNVTNYINRAGDFALSANKERIFIMKAGSGTWYKPHETELESGDRIFIDRIPYDELNAQRTYEVQREQIKNTRIQLIMTGLSTITGIITTYVAITR